MPGVFFLIWQEGWGCVKVGGRDVVCAVACCVSGLLGAVGWERGSDTAGVSVCGFGWGKSQLFGLCLDMLVGCR